MTQATLVEQIDLRLKLLPLTKLMVVYDFVSYLTERDPDQAWFWTPEGQAGEQAADEDLQSGDYEDFDNMDDLIAALNSEKVMA
jgi:hypothetical protein